MQTVFTNDMVAHVWAQQTQHFGRSHNGQFYFEGPALYSYGAHYMVGLFAPDGTVFLNSTNSSRTTEGKHKNAARRALPNYGRDAARLPDLEDIAPVILRAGRNGGRIPASAPGHHAETVRRYLVKHWQEIPADSTGAQWLLTAIGSRGTWAAMRARHAGQLAKAQAKNAKGLRLAQQREGRKFVAHTIRDIRGEVWGEGTRGRYEMAFDIRNARLATPAAHKARRAALYDRERVARAIMRRIDAIRLSYPYQVASDRIRAHAALDRLRRFMTGQIDSFVPGYDGPSGPAKRDAALALPTGAGWRVFADTLQVVVRHASMPARLRQAAVALQAYAHDRASQLEGEAAIRADISRARTHVLRELRVFNAARRDWRAYKESGQADEPQNARVASRMLASISARVPGPNPYVTESGFTHNPALAARARRIAQAAGELLSGYENDRARYLDAWERAESERQQAAHARKLELAGMDRAQLTAEYRAGRLTDNEARDVPGPVMLKAVMPQIDGCRVTGGNLVTNQGATVPLAHAFRVFQFLAYCRANGKAWRPADSRDALRAAFRHGPARIRVGHFQVDQIDATGDFKAGCHAIKWPDVAALAESLGVADCLISHPSEIEGEPA